MRQDAYFRQTVGQENRLFHEISLVIMALD